MFGNRFEVVFCQLANGFDLFVDGVFHRDEPIIYTGKGVPSEPEFESDFSDEENMTAQELEVAKMKRSKLKEQLCVPTPDIGPSVAFLRSCRQLYHEAVGVLYSDNTILISVDLHCHKLE